MSYRSLQVKITFLCILILGISVMLLTGLSMKNTDNSLELAASSFAAVTTNLYGEESIEFDKEFQKLNRGIVMATILEEPIIYVDALKIQATNNNFLAMITVIITSSLLMGYLVKRSFKPVKTLNDAVNKINENNLSMQIEGFSSCQEVEQLAESFNTMTRRLNESFTNQKLFASNAAHELKTPLASIQTNIESIELGGQASIEEYKEIIAITKRNVQRLSQLVDQLLQMNQENHLIMNEQIDLPVLFDRIKTNYQTMIEENELNVTIKCSVLTMVGNENLFERAFSNLLENAIKYNYPQGEIGLEVSEVNSDIQIIFSNTTEDIKPEELNKIFNPFYRIDDSRSRKNGGSGLGLAIVKTIVEKHQGHIEVSYQENHIRFIITI